MKDRTVQEGECLASIAFESGFFHETLWEHEKNAALKSKRASPHILHPGDVVHVPDLRVKEIDAATGKRHRFRRRGVPEVLKLQLLEEGKPRAGLAYMLTIDGDPHPGRTDAEGRLLHYLPPNAREGRLVLDPDGEHPEEVAILLRRLDPIDQVSGVQARLQNLGFYTGQVDGIASPEVRDALLAFQQRQGLAATGEADAATRDALRTQHGS